MTPALLHEYAPTIVSIVVGIIVGVYARLAAKRGKLAVAASNVAKSAAASVLKTVTGQQQQQAADSKATAASMAALKTQNEQLMATHQEALTELRQMQQAGRHREDTAPSPVLPSTSKATPVTPNPGTDPNPSTESVWTKLGG